MSQRKTSSNNPEDWLAFADAELDALRLLSANKTAFLMCRSKCAEVLEKIMKAELIFMGWPLIKTHDLQQLADELKVRGSDHVERIQPLAEELSEYYVVGRYPGFDLDEREDWAALVVQVERVAEYANRVRQAIAENHSNPESNAGAGT